MFIVVPDAWLLPFALLLLLLLLLVMRKSHTWGTTVKWGHTWIGS